MTKEKINDEFERLLNSADTKKDNSTFDKNVFTTEITNNINNLKNNYLSCTNDTDFCTEENITIFKTIIDLIINSVITFSINIDNIEDMKIGKYDYLYDTYYQIDNILSYEDSEDMLSALKDCAYNIKRYLNSDIFDWFFEAKNKEELFINDYQEIAAAIERVIQNNSEVIDYENAAVYYVDNQKSFYVNDNKYYEIEIRNAIDYGNKNNKQLVYSKNEVRRDSAVRLSLVNEKINFLGQSTDIFVITSSKISIRPCEIKNLINLLACGQVIVPRGKFYNTLMNYLEENNCNLYDIVTANDGTYDSFINIFDGKINSKESICFVNFMAKARNMITNEEKGSNVIRYLLGNINNSVIKNQTDSNIKYCVEGTYICNRSLQFERKPYAYSLYNHTPKYADIARTIPPKLYQNDLIARNMDNYKKEKQTAFAPISEIPTEDIHSFIDGYNSDIYSSANALKLYKDKYVYVEQNYKDLSYIISKIKNYSENDNDGTYLTEKNTKISSFNIDSDEKKNILNSAFNNSQILLIYGEAGSGKTELICNYLTKIFEEKEILFIANTHAAKNNMRRRVEERLGNADRYNFTTVKSITRTRNNYYYDVVIIDECKTITNMDAKKLFENLDFDYCILSGDVAQIDAIGLGNWFEVSKEFAGSSAFELKNNYRTIDSSLKQIWDKVRNHDESVYDDFEKNNIFEQLSQKIYEPLDSEEIILCLNYGGRYGINKINSYFQNSEQKKNEKSCTFNLNKYCVGDPIVFNNDATAINKYDGIIYNNLKGKIVDISEDEKNIYFELKIETYIDRDMKLPQNITRISSNYKDNYSIIGLEIKKYHENDDDTNDEEYAIPFDVAYARSIHKSQGLEYNSVKVIITPESEEIIDNAIFYTAITRAKKHLKIYSLSEEIFKKMDLLSKKDEIPDAEIIKDLDYNNNL